MMERKSEFLLICKEWMDVKKGEEGWKKQYSRIDGIFIQNTTFKGKVEKSIFESPNDSFIFFIQNHLLNNI